VQSACHIEDKVEAMTSPPTAKDKPSAAARIPPKGLIIEVHRAELKRLLDAINPLPFRDRYSNVTDPDARRGDWHVVSPRGGAKDDRGPMTPCESGKLMPL
jgi:hypothetical protein